MEAEPEAFHERVRRGFLDLAARDPKRYLVLDATDAPAAIAAAVVTRIGGALPAAPAGGSTPPTSRPTESAESVRAAR
jgi:dTMP kinase